MVLGWVNPPEFALAFSKPYSLRLVAYLGCPPGTPTPGSQEGYAELVALHAAVRRGGFV